MVENTKQDPRRPDWNIMAEPGCQQPRVDDEEAHGSDHSAETVVCPSSSDVALPSTIDEPNETEELIVPEDPAVSPDDAVVEDAINGGDQLDAKDKCDAAGRHNIDNSFAVTLAPVLEDESVMKEQAAKQDQAVTKDDDLAEELTASGRPGTPYPSDDEKSGEAETRAPETKAPETDGSKTPASERRGSERRGSERRGSERRGSERRGSERRGSERQGSEANATPMDEPLSLQASQNAVSFADSGFYSETGETQRCREAPHPTRNRPTKSQAEDPDAITAAPPPDNEKMPPVGPDTVDPGAVENNSPIAAALEDTEVPVAVNHVKAAFQRAVDRFHRA